MNTLIDEKKESTETYLDGVFRCIPLIFGFIMPLVGLILALHLKNNTAALVVFAWLCISITVNCTFQIIRWDLMRALEDATDEIKNDR